MAGAIGLSGSSWGLQRGSHCVGVGGSGGGTSGETIGIACCTDDGYPQPNGHGGAWCYNPDALPGQPPQNPPHDPPGHHPAGTDGDDDDDDEDPPECKPGERPFPPSGKLVGISLKAGESIELTDEWLKNHPEVEYVENTPAEIVESQKQIETYLVEKAKEPKPKCNETCRSCRADRDGKVARKDQEAAECVREHEKDAQHNCELGGWRGDPRRECGLFDSPEFCGTPGDRVPSDECEYVSVGPPGHEVMRQVCTETDEMKACKRSWMNDVPATVAEHQSGSTTGTINLPWNIGSISHTFGTDKVTVTIPAGSGYRSGCIALADAYKDKVRNEVYPACVRRVEAANPGVTCP